MIESIGRHRLRAGSIMDGGDAEIIRMVGEPVDYIYSDPPWGAGNLKFWHTINRKNTGQDITAPGEDEFLMTLFSLMKRVSKQQTVIFIEYSCKGWETLSFYASKVQLRLFAEGETRYRSGKKLLPMMVGVFAYEPPPALSANHMDRVNGTHGQNTVYAMARGFPMSGRRILDPCCGVGNTARLALLKDMTFYGNELNAARLLKTKDVLARGER